MIWMTEKTIQKAVFPLPKTCGETHRSEGCRGRLLPCPMSALLLAQAVGLGFDYRGAQDGPLGKQQDLSCSGRQDECTHWGGRWEGTLPMRCAE